MITIRQDELLGRPLRVDELNELGDNTIDKLKQVIKSGDQKLALDIAEYLLYEGASLHDTYTDWIFSELDFIAKNYGEEELPKVLRFVRETLDKNGAQKKRAKGNLLLKVQLIAETMRVHRSGREERGNLKIWEEADRYVVESDPCGAGGRMAIGPNDGSGSRIKPPFNLGTTTKPYPWSWSKKGVPYYCLHCCLWQEIIPIEKQGYPARIAECPAPNFDKPCRFYFYKTPEAIPAEYFERVGYKKDPSKFKK
jgi:hypothetical protein